MTTPEKIAVLAAFFLKLNKQNPDFAYVFFSAIKEVTGIPKNEARDICELLRKKGYIRFSYGPAMDTESVFIPSEGFDSANFSDPKGLMFFFSRGTADFPKTEIGEADFSKLEEVVTSAELRNKLAKELRPQIQYDAQTSKLISNGKSTFIRSHNSRVLAEKVFSLPPEGKLLENDIAPLLDDVIPRSVKKNKKDEYQLIYNVVNRVNEKIEKITGIHHLIQFRQGKIWTE